MKRTRTKKQRLRNRRHCAEVEEKKKQKVSKCKKSRQMINVSLCSSSGAALISSSAARLSRFPADINHCAHLLRGAIRAACPPLFPLRFDSISLGHKLTEDIAMSCLRNQFKHSHFGQRASRETPQLPKAGDVWEKKITQFCSMCLFV